VAQKLTQPEDQTQEERILGVLEDLRQTEGILHAFLARRDASWALGASPIEPSLIELSASLLADSEEAGTMLGFEGHDQTIVEFGNGRLLVTRCPPHHVVALVLGTAVNVGLAVLLARKAAERIEPLLPKA
jgi:predicted regulator of Ras-like GTPase activity (Roadblock/LC7/MglB family)